jgi:hypothetical protein
MDTDAATGFPTGWICSSRFRGEGDGEQIRVASFCVEGPSRSRDRQSEAVISD